MNFWKVLEYQGFSISPSHPRHPCNAGWPQTHYMGKTGFEHLILPTLPARCCDCSCVSPYTAQGFVLTVLQWDSRGKHPSDATVGTVGRISSGPPLKLLWNVLLILKRAEPDGVLAFTVLALKWCLFKGFLKLLLAPQEEKAHGKTVKVYSLNSS